MCRRFVILFHSVFDSAHWDVMLETADDLTVWSIPPQWLPLSAFQVSAESLLPHRKFYLDYEGAVSGNRGTVRRVDAGFYENVGDDEDTFVFRVHGQKMNGILKVHGDVMIFCPEKTQLSGKRRLLQGELNHYR